MNIEIFVISGLMIVVAYLLGSIPFGYIYARFKGIDITAIGSGNTGATNIYRQFGMKAALFVFLGDMLKGTLAVAVSEYVLHVPEPAVILVCIAAILGHSKSIFIKFKGGKAVATGVGVVLALNWIVALSVFGIWVVVFLGSRIVSLASIVAAASAMPVAFLLHMNQYYFYFIVVASLFVIYRHKDNIVRLLEGTEKPIARNNTKSKE